jgi:glycopeptide antibiotics resistance protein
VQPRQQVRDAKEVPHEPIRALPFADEFERLPDVGLVFRVLPDARRHEAPGNHGAVPSRKLLGTAMQPGTRRRRGRIALWLAILSAAFIVYGTTIPFRFLANRRLVVARWHRMTWNPLFPMADGRRIRIPDAAQNILLFVPFGIFAAGALPRGTSSRRRVIVATAAGTALSVGVEGLQLMDVGRTASFGDVVCNTCGAALGAFASPPVLEALARSVRRLKQLGALDAPTTFPVLIGVALVCLAAWAPFDVTLDVGIGLRKLAALGRDPWQADGPAREAAQLLRFVVLTLLTASWLKDLGIRRPHAVAMSACGLLAAFLELSQILIESRMPGLADVSMNLAGVAAGGLLFQFLGGAPSLDLWVVPFAAAIWLTAAVPMLSPTRSSTTSQPFWALWFEYPRYTRFFPRHIFDLFVLCFPLGFVLAITVKRAARLYLVAIAAAVVCGGLLAVLARSMRAGNPTILDVAIVVLGSIAGAWTARTGWVWFNEAVHALEDAAVDRLVELR